jgi:hypothetical protein
MRRGFLTRKLEVLGRRGNYGTRENLAVPANAGAGHNRHVGANPGAFPDFNVLINGREGLYYYVLRNLSLGVNIGEWLVHSNSFNNE